MMGPFHWFAPRTKTVPRTEPNVDYSLALAVPDTDPLWLAVMQVLDEAERETVQGARDRIKDTNLVLSAIGAGEGIELVRQKLIDKRTNALRTPEEVRKAHAI